ncbi:MAG: S53 family peptidase, partial [Acidobacteriota bacterium]
MAVSRKRTTVPGSEKKALPNARAMTAVNPAERIEVTVILRPRTGAGSRAKAAGDVMRSAMALPEQRAYLTREAFAAERGAAPDDVAKVENFAREHNLTVVEASVAKRSVRLAGTVKDLTDAFRPNLKYAKLGGRKVRTRTGGISVPDSLAPIVVAVLGFDNRRAATPHVRFLGGTPPAPVPHGRVNTRGAAKGTSKRAAKRVAHASNGTFTPPEVAKLYNFPAGLDGSGQCIAIIELNDFDENVAVPRPISTGFTLKDLKAYFSSLGLPTPDVTAVAVASDGSAGANLPGPDPNADGEVMLDIEVAGAVAPKANIAVYFALNTDNGFLAALNTALHDNVRKPSVISISWGSTEDLNTVQALNAFNLVLQDAAALGVTVCCSSGDDGSSDIRKPSERDGKPHVDFPASSPFALACGGTKLRASGAAIGSEVVWHSGGGGTGGGVSNHFARPP